MIAENDIYKAPADVWARLAAPLPSAAISWRQDGKPVTRDGKIIARFVCYVEAGTVRERLDSVVPGEWDLSFKELPDMVSHEGTETVRAFKARLQVLGVVREDVGQGDDYKSAATDAFKRAAVRFGIGHELYQMGQIWVELDGDGKYAKPVEDPSAVYARKHGNGAKPAVAAKGKARTTKTAPASQGTSVPMPLSGHVQAALTDDGSDAPTRDTPFPRGSMRGKTVREMSNAQLEWGIEEGRNLGGDTEAWQQVMRAELESRQPYSLAVTQSEEREELSEKIGAEA